MVPVTAIGAELVGAAVLALVGAAEGEVGAVDGAELATLVDGAGALDFEAEEPQAASDIGHSASRVTTITSVAAYH